MAIESGGPISESNDTRLPTTSAVRLDNADRMSFAHSHTELEIAFHTGELREICIDESIADRRLGASIGAALRNRLGDLRAADSVFELAAGHPHAGQFDGQDCYRLALVNGAWLTFVPNHVEPRRSADETTDWARVRYVRVVHVGS